MPLVARDLAALDAAAREAAELRPDLVEWRADCFDSIGSPGALPAALALLRGRLPDMPLLFTCRSHREGGVRVLGEAERESLYKAAIDSGGCDLVDIELAACAAVRRAVVDAAGRKGVAVILSAHDFASTPDADSLTRTLLAEQEAGASIAKIAVTPQNEDDVFALFAAVRTARARLRIPLIAVSMGRLGVVSRVCADFFGSAVTFGAGREASAPGQIGVEKLREFLHALRESS